MTATRREIRLLGELTVLIDGEPVRVSRDNRNLLAFVALEHLARAHTGGGAPAERRKVAGTLWPDVTDDRALSLLRHALSRGSAKLVLDVGRTHLRCGKGVVIDVEGVAARARRLAQGVEDDLSLEALQLDLLTDLDAPWILIERERHRLRRTHALERICEMHLACGRWPEAVEAAQAAVDADPLRESATRLLIEAHRRHGNTVAAMQRYEEFKARLAEIGARESAQLVRLLDEVTSG